MIIDSSVLLLVVDATDPFHGRGRAWWETTIRGHRRVGLPWSVLNDFLQISTDAAVCAAPLEPAQAWTLVDAWLREETVWVPEPTQRHATVLADLIGRHRLRGADVGRAQLVALAMTHGVPLYTLDRGFARFAEVPRVNPLLLAQRRW